VRLALLALGVALAGCISSAPIVPVTSANSAQISSCQGTATLHNDVVIGGFVLGGATSGLATAAAAFTDQNTKTDLAIAGAIAGAVLIADTAVAGFAASNFANSQCSSVVGALPVSPLGTTTVKATP